MTAKKKKPIIALAVVSALLTALILWIIWGNTALAAQQIHGFERAAAPSV